MSEQPHAAHDDHGHGHGHGSRFIQHHYDDAQHQFDSGKLGIWLFLAQEVLFFSALFVAYIIYRHHHPEIYSYAHKYLDVKYGAINTAVLIFSSLTAAWAVRCAQLNQKRGLILCIVVTLGCALAFLGIKYIEYNHKIHEHILFGRYFDPCVSSGGVPLLTKNNECHGSKSNVHWNPKGGLHHEGAPKDPTKTLLLQPPGPAQELRSCYGDVGLDHDRRTPGVQASCKVFELTVDHLPKKKPNDQPTAKPNGLTEKQWGDGDTEAFVEKSRREITKQCPDPLAAHDGHGGGHGDPAAYPCWKATAQPAVCKGGWFFTWRCIGTCAPSGGEGFDAVGPFPNQGECTLAKMKKDGELKKLLKEARQDEKNAITTDCTTSNASGFLVEYGDHQARGDNIVITAECRPPPAEVKPADPYADVAHAQPELGTPAIQPQRHETTHDLHAKEAAGPPPPHTNMFFTIYFAMTGLHGIHVLAGVIVFLWLLIRASKGHFTSDYFGPVDYAALYWHIVDLIWIFLFPLLYLIH
ncbi:MAG: cytochrome c oxidase subunit 3 [Kofleriaceae bacterium]